MKILAANDSSRYFLPLWAVFTAGLLCGATLFKVTQKFPSSEVKK
jgi:hypothetical protein